MKKKANGFTLVELLVVIAILGILMASLFPAISSAILKAQTTAMASNGRNLFLGITGANTEREQAGLPTVWPQTVKVDGVDATDIAGQGPYSSSTTYFNDLFCLTGKGGAAAYGSKDWRPWVDVDISKLSGSGVPGFSGGQLKPDNIGWVILGNVQAGIDEIIPVLVSRNVNYKNLKVDSYDGTDNAEIKCGKDAGGDADTPFGSKAWVLVRMDGATEVINARYSRMKVIYKNMGFNQEALENKLQYLPTK